MHGEHSTAGPLETRSAASATNASGADPGHGEAPRPKDGSSTQEVDALVSSFLDELDAISVTWSAGVEPPRKEDIRPETPPEASRAVPPPAPEEAPEPPSPESFQVPAEAPAPSVLPDAAPQAAGPGAAGVSAEPAPALIKPYIGTEPALPEVAAESVETALPPVVSEAGPESVDLEAAELAGLAPPSDTALVADQGPAHLEPEVTEEVLDLQLAETLDELEREQLRVVPLRIHEKAGPTDAGQGQAVASEAPGALHAAEYLAGQALSAASPAPPGVGEGEPADLIPHPIPDHAGTWEISRDQAAGDATRDGSPGLVGTGVAPPPAAVEAPGEDSSNVVPLPEHPGGDEPMPAEVVEDSLTEAAPEQASAAAQTKAAVLAKILSSNPVVAEKPRSSPDAESALRDIFQVRQTKRGAFKGVLSVALIVAGLGLGYEIIQYLRSNPAWVHESNAPAAAPGEVATSPAGGAPAADAAAGDTVPAVPIQKVIPPYPETARSLGIAGEVEFEVDVDEKGNVTRANPISGPEVFYADAGQALRKWVFQPASRQGVPIHSTVRVTIEFKP